MTEIPPVLEAPVKNPILSDSMYTKLEFLARVVLPALGVLYAALAALWGFPHPTQVVGSIVAVDTFLGVFLGVAQKSYDASDSAYDGAINVTTSPEGNKLFSLEVNNAPEDLEGQDKVVFKVNPVS